MERWATWGWYSVLFDLAESGIFNVPGCNSIASAMNANFYEAFIWLGKKSDYSTI